MRPEFVEQVLREVDGGPRGIGLQAKLGAEQEPDSCFEGDVGEDVDVVVLVEHDVGSLEGVVGNIDIDVGVEDLDPRDCLGASEPLVREL